VPTPEKSDFRKLAFEAPLPSGIVAVDFQLMNEKVQAWLILIALVCVVAGAYLVAWRGRTSAYRRGASWIVALVSGLAGLVTTSGVIEGLEDFHNPEVSIWTVLIGTLIMLALTIGAWVMAIRFAIIALRKGPLTRHQAQRMLRKLLTAVAVLVVLVLAIAVGRLYVGIPFVPSSGREIVARLSGLPIPAFARSEGAVEECSGGFCRDYYGRGLVQLSPAACANAVAAARTQGWQPLPPLPKLTIGAVGQEIDPPRPDQGYFRFEQKRPTEHRFAWIDTTTCRVYAELDIK
jgi:hypothetical protein